MSENFQDGTIETFYVCRGCVDHLTGEELLDYRPLVIQEGNVTEWICPRCGKQIAWFMDGGTVDLGLVRDEVLSQGGNDFEIFP